MRRVEFAEFSDRILEELAHVSGPMYRRVHQKFWNNSMFGDVKRPYRESDYEAGVSEFYFPTFKYVGRSMGYQRVVAKTFPGLDPEMIDIEAEKLRSKRFVCGGRGPAGHVDSETIVFFAPHLGEGGLDLWCEDQGREARGERPKRDWFMRGKRISRGVYLMVIVESVPEIAVRCLLERLIKFINRRLRRLLGDLHLSIDLPALERGRSERSLFYTAAAIIEKAVGLTLANCVRCLYETMAWFKKKMKEIREEIGRQNMIKRVIQQVAPVLPLIREIRSSRSPFKNAKIDDALAMVINRLGPGPP